jgi:hypothetical protein
MAELVPHFSGGGISCFEDIAAGTNTVEIVEDTQGGSPVW